MKYYLPGTLGLLLVLAGCDSGPPPVFGNGTLAREARTVEHFDAVGISGQGRVEITIGPEIAVEVEGDENVLALIETVVQEGTLKVRRLEQIRPKQPLVVRVRAPDLKSIGIGGVANCEAGPFHNDALDLSLAGTGSVTLTGQTVRLVANMAGASKLDATGLYAEDVELNLAGAGKADVVAARTLDVELAGLGKVTYAGSPEIKKSVVGLSSIKQRSPVAEAPAESVEAGDADVPQTQPSSDGSP